MTSPDDPFCVVILGPPGSGKGTQAKRLCGMTGAEYVGTGDLLRDAAQRSTPRGERLRGRLATGELLPSDEVTALIAPLIRAASARGRSLVLDGYPRRPDQGQSLDDLVGGSCRPIAVLLEVDLNECAARISTRTICSDCSRSSPDNADVCTHCGQTTTKRADDSSGATIERRLSLYQQETQPLISFYEDSGRLTRVPGTGSEDSVFETLSDHLGLHGSRNV